MAESPARRTTGGMDVGTMIIVVGITLTWVLGTIGGAAFNTGDDAQAVFTALSGIAGSAAFFLIAVRHMRSGLELSAAGFALLAVLNVAGSVAGYTGEGPNSVLGNLAIMFLPALVLIALQEWAPIWSRLAGTLSGILLLIAGCEFILGDEPLDMDSPLLIGGFILLSIAAIGWALQVWKEGSATAA